VSLPGLGKERVLLEVDARQLARPLQQQVLALDVLLQDGLRHGESEARAKRTVDPECALDRLGQHATSGESRRIGPVGPRAEPHLLEPLGHRGRLVVRHR
jgi:hypothetical protein